MIFLPLGMFLGSMDYSGAQLCACRLTNVAQRSTHCVCNLMFSHVFIGIFRRGRRFYCENIEFPFRVFCESAGELAGTILVPLRLPGATRGPLVLVP